MIHSGFIGRILKLPLLFWVTVGIPTSASIIYYSLIASDRYVSESRFVVRSPTKSSQSNLLSQVISGSGYSNVSADSYPVIDYMRSRDALKELNQVMDIRSIYTMDGDFLSRYHSSVDGTFESLWRYYKKSIVNVTLDDVSSIITLKTNGYTANDALAINQRLLDLGESLVNEMNKKASLDGIAFAENEVKRAQDKAVAASVALARYRQENSVFDPSRQSLMELEQVSMLQQKAYVVESEISQLKNISPQSPQLTVLAASLITLHKQIANQHITVTGNKDSLTQKSVAYTKLQLESDVANQSLGGALAMLVSAREQAERKHLYFERIIQPNLPDEAILPKRLRGIITTLLAGLVSWAVLSLFFASMREHRE